MLQLRYDNRHTFFISLGVIIFLFGIYPFYRYDIDQIFIKIIIFHFLGLIVGVYLCKKGMTIWKERDNEELEITKFIKEEIEKYNELKKLEIESQKLRIDKDKLLFDLSTVKKDLNQKKQKKEIIEKETKEKLKEIEKLKEDIEKKQKELLDKEKNIYDRRETSISGLPNTITVSGATMYPSTGSTMTSSEVTTIMTYPYYPDGSLCEKKCKICKKIYIPDQYFDMSICPECQKNGERRLDWRK